MKETNKIDDNSNIENLNKNTFNKLKTIQILLKKESALKNLYLNTFKNIQNDINKVSREIFEQKLKVINIIETRENPSITINHELVESNKDYMKELYLYIPKLIVHLWENPSLMAKLLLATNNTDIKKYLAPLICDNFYENILSPNYLEDKVALVIYILLEKEINNLKDINDSKNFLNNTPCSYLLNELIEKKDIKEFFRIVLKDNIENFELSSSDTKLILDPLIIEKTIIEKQKQQKRINSKKNEKEKKKEISEEEKKQITEETKKMNELFFSKYSLDTSLKNLRNKENINLGLNKNQIDNYIKLQFKENLKEDDDIYSNNEFFKLMNTNSDNADEILNEYISNFLKIINFIDSIFNSIIENLDLLPFSIKCICTMISILLDKKFPNINELEKYRFISRFIFNNLLVSVLNNPTQGALINNYIISNNTMYNMNVAIKIIETFSSFDLYEVKNSFYSPFNNYFIENVHKLIKISEVLIKTKMPNYINKIIEGKISVNEKYDFFKENSDDILYCRSIFLSMNHIKIMMKGVIHFLHEEDNFFKKIVSKIIDNKENMQLLIELAEENDKVIKKTIKNEKGKKIQINEKNIKYFLFNDLIYNEKYKYLFSNENNTYFKLEEKIIKDKTNRKEILDNLIIKTKNLISSSLSNYRILEETNFGDGNTENTFSILKKLKHFMKSTNYLVDEGIPSEWYIESLLENLKKFPNEYKQDDFSKLYDDLEQDIKKEIISHDFEKLSTIVARTRFSKRRKDFYSHLKDVLIDINMNNKVNNIIEKDEINIKIYFKYDVDVENRKLNIYKEDISEKQLDFLNSFVFQEDKDVKTCKTIKSFTNMFPDLNKYANSIIETKNVFDLQKELNVPKELNAFFDAVKNHLINTRKIKDEKELSLIYDKIYDYVWSKIYNKLYPKQTDIMDMSLQQKFNLYSWIEPFHLIEGNYNYNFELILPKIINYFGDMNIEKSPRKKIMNMNHIFESINALLEFNQNKINIGVDNQMPLLNYIFIKAKPKNIFTNCDFMELYIGDKIRKKEGNYLIQLKSIRDFTLNLTHNKLLNITFDEFNKNCEIALENKEKT